MSKVLVTEDYLQDIADAIREKVGDSATYTPAQMGDAIRNIPSGGGGGDAQVSTGTFVSASSQYGIVDIDCGFKPDLVLVTLPFSNGDTTSYWWKDASWAETSAIWCLRPAENNAYVVALGRTKGETGIQAINDNGFSFMVNGSNTRGVTCNYIAIKAQGSSNTDSDFILKYSTAEASGSFTVAQDGVYMIVCATSHGQTHSVTIPQTATIIDTQSADLGNGRGIEVTIASLSAGDTVSITQSWSNWVGRAFAIVRLESITVGSNVDFEATGDAATTVSVLGGTKHLVLGVGIGATYRNDTLLSNSAMLLSGAWGNRAICALYLTDKSETFSFYGYDGGMSSVGVWEVQ